MPKKIVKSAEEEKFRRTMITCLKIFKNTIQSLYTMPYVILFFKNDILRAPRPLVTYLFFIIHQIGHTNKTCKLLHRSLNHLLRYNQKLVRELVHEYALDLVKVSAQL